jgi:hypothetical protein
MIAAYQSNHDNDLVNECQARQVAGLLSLLISIVGPRSSLGIVLQQARSEISSLLRSQNEMPHREAA